MINKYKDDVRKQYLLSSLIGSIIPILLLSLVYLYTSASRLKQNVDASMLDKLDLVKNNIDLQIKNMESSSMHFSSNLKPIDKYKSGKVNEISLQLNLYKKNYPFVEEVLFYIRGDENIFNTSKVMPYYQFQDEIRNEADLDMTQFFMNMFSIMSSRLIPTKLSQPYNLNGGRFLVYMHPIPLLDTSPVGTMAFLIDKKSFADIAVDYMGDFTGYLCIFDASMYPVFDQNNGINISPDITNQLSKLKGIGIFNLTIDNQKYVAVRTVSQISGYNYVLLMPRSKFYASLWTVLNTFSLVVTIIVTLSVIMAVILAMRLYAPIKTLIDDMFLQSIGKNDAVHNNETDIFERIRYEYKSVLTRNNELLLQVGNQRSLVRDQLLTNLLCGRFKNQSDIELNMKCANVSFDYNFFFALYIKFNDKSSMLLENTSIYLDQVYFKDGKAYAVELEDGRGFGVITNVSISDNQKLEDIRKNTAAMFNNMLIQYGCTDLLIGVGDVRQDITDIDMSFIEAEEATNGTIENGNIVLYSLSCKRGKPGYVQPTAERALYYQSLLKGNTDAAMAILNTMFYNMEHHSNSYVIVRSFSFYIFNTIVEVADIIGFHISENEIAKSAAFSNLDEFKKCVVNTTIDICKYTADQQSAKSQQLKNDIIKYVAGNFSDYDISIDKLAEIFNLSQSYLGKFFKNETGYNFLQYITMLRMDYIKRKLVTSDDPIKNIVQSAGYSDVSNFIRKFKSSEGMTPGQFREMFTRLKQVD